MASLTQKATGRGGAFRLSTPPTGGLEFRSQPSSPSSDHVDITLDDLEDFPFSQDYRSSTSVGAPGGSLSHDVLSQAVGVDLCDSPTFPAKGKAHAGLSKSACVAVPTKPATFREALESEDRKHTEELFDMLSQALHVSSCKSPLKPVTYAIAPRRLRSGPNPRPAISRHEWTPIVGPVTSPSAALSSKGKDDPPFLKPGPLVSPKPSAVSSVAATGAGKNGDASSGKNGEASSGPIDKGKDDGTSKESKGHRALARSAEDNGTAPGASLMKRVSASSVSHPTTSDKCCQTDDYWVKILESENGTPSSIVGDEYDRDLDSDDASILRQLKSRQASRVASEDNRGPEVDMSGVLSSEKPVFVPGNGSATRVCLGTANGGTVGSSNSAELDVQFNEASATLGILHKVYSSKVQKKLKNRYEHYRAQRDSETSLVSFRGSLKRSAERELDRDMDVLEGDINETLDLAQALEESSNFDLGIVLKRRKLGWVQQGTFGYRSLQ